MSNKVHIGLLVQANRGYNTVITGNMGEKTSAARQSYLHCHPAILPPLTSCGICTFPSLYLRGSGWRLGDRGMPSVVAFSPGRVFVKKSLHVLRVTDGTVQGNTIA